VSPAGPLPPESAVLDDDAAAPQDSNLPSKDKVSVEIMKRPVPVLLERPSRNVRAERPPRQERGSRRRIPPTARRLWARIPRPAGALATLALIWVKVNSNGQVTLKGHLAISAHDPAWPGRRAEPSPVVSVAPIRLSQACLWRAAWRELELQVQRRAPQGMREDPQCPTYPAYWDARPAFVGDTSDAHSGTIFGPAVRLGSWERMPIWGSYAQAVASWVDFAAARPDLAEAGRDLLYQHGVGLAYLASVRRDGGPRVHPMCPLLGSEGLFAFIVPSPKQADLLRDGRYSMHSFPRADNEDAFYLTGTARLVEDPGARSRLSAVFVSERKALGVSIPSKHELLFGFAIASCLLTRTTGHGDPNPTHTVWHAPNPI
jgi:hypothetical protein